MNDIEIIKLDLIDEFPNHPFKVIENDDLIELANSIKNNGLLNPLIVMKKDNGRYQLISGHRRKKALELNGESYAEAFIKNITDEEATVFMVDSNLQREKLLPSEKAFAYKMKYDALKHQGKTSGNSCTKLRSDEEMAIKLKESARTIQNYIRLTFLIPELLELVDNTVLFDKRTHLTMGLLPAIELSYLKEKEQKIVLELIEYEQVTPSHSQAKEIRKLSEKNEISFNVLDKLFLQNKGNQNEKITFNKIKIESVLPTKLKNRDKRYIEQYIINAIKQYNEKQNEDDFEDGWDELNKFID